MFKKFITRPVLAIVIALVFLILGSVSLQRLPITLYPDIAQPCISVYTTYPGANAEIVSRSIAPILEEAINGAENMTYMTSSVGNDGSLNINVFFEVGTNPDIAAVNVQNRVATVTSRLPEAVIRAGITTNKEQKSQIMTAGLESTDEKYDEIYLQNYLTINVVPALKRIQGVSKVELFGIKDYSMRVWLQPERLTAYGITVEEVDKAIKEQNIEIAPGILGENSDENFQYNVIYKGKYTTPEEYGGIIIREDGKGGLVYLRDIAKIELGALLYTSSAKVNNHSGVCFMVYQTSGSNANDIQIKIQELFKEEQSKLPPSMRFVTLFSSKASLDASIHQVKSTLIEALVLVFFIVFFFLQDWRSTLIIGVSIPVSIIGAFLGMHFAGFSINLLTLFGLVLCVGLVVDDAVVVVEAVNQALTKKGTNTPLLATQKAMTEITGAVISTTLVMVAVFAPVAFIEGSVGGFYQQFAFTIITAIVISGVCALILCPALSALLLRSPDDVGGKWYDRLEHRFRIAFDIHFGYLTNKYLKVVVYILRNFKKSLLVFFAMILGIVLFFSKTSTGFIPDEDDSFLMVNIVMPSATSLTKTEEVVAKADSIVRTYDFIRESATVCGYDLLNASTSSSTGVVVVSLKPYKERNGAGSIWEIGYMINERLTEEITDATFITVKKPALPGFGEKGGVELVLQDRTAEGDLQKFSEVADDFIKKLAERPEVDEIYHTFHVDYPQYELLIDFEKAKLAGVSIDAISSALQVYWGSLQTSDFSLFGKNLKVVLQGDIESRRNLEALNFIHVISNKGESIPISNFVHLDERQGAVSITRFNMFNSININIIPKTGVSTGDMIPIVEEVYDQEIPNNYSFEWQGMVREQIKTGGSTALVFILSIVLIYLILSGLYESFIMPLPVLLSVPTTLVGVLAGIHITGIDNNIFVQVAMLILIGLIAKNSILIVEFGMQLREEGHSIAQAAVLAAKSRLRPILMTSLTAFLGALPMMFVTGMSAVGNFVIGLTMVAGLFSGIVLGVLLAPLLFVVFMNINERLKGRKKGQNIKEELRDVDMTESV